MDAFRTVAVASRLYQRTMPQASFLFKDLLLNEQREDRAGQASEVAEQDDGSLPAECDAASGGVNEHQARVDCEDHR